MFASSYSGPIILDIESCIQSIFNCFKVLCRNRIIPYSTGTCSVAVKQYCAHSSIGLPSISISIIVSIFTWKSPLESARSQPTIASTLQRWSGVQKYRIRYTSIILQIRYCLFKKYPNNPLIQLTTSLVPLNPDHLSIYVLLHLLPSRTVHLQNLKALITYPSLEPSSPPMSSNVLIEALCGSVHTPSTPCFATPLKHLSRNTPPPLSHSKVYTTKSPYRDL